MAREAQGLSDVIEYAVQQQKTGKTVESEGETVMRQFCFRGELQPLYGPR